MKYLKKIIIEMFGKKKIDSKDKEEKLIYIKVVKGS